MKRRSFLKSSSILSLPTLMGGFKFSAVAKNEYFHFLNTDTDKVLILVDLNGGNDGLASFVPLNSFDNLANARPNLYIPQNRLLNLSDTLSLHPSMQGMQSLYNNSNLAVVQNVAYPNQNRSHFRSADIWNTGVKADEFKNTGWMGRYLDDQYPGYPNAYPNEEYEDPFALSLGSSVSGNCQGANSNFSLAILNPDQLEGLPQGVEAPLPNDCYGAELGFIVQTYKQTNSYSERIVNASQQGNNLAEYADTLLAEQFKMVARLISGGLQTKVFVISQGGYDTHAAQVEEDNTSVGSYATLIGDLSDAILSFQDDMAALGLAERVVGMTFSEFGRKIKSNAGLGTDHGTAGPMIFFGSCIHPGIIGDNPEIATHVDANEGVPMQYDFKSVYGSVLMDWFGVLEEEVRHYLDHDFQYIPIINNCENSVHTQETTTTFLEVSAFPNPFTDHIKLKFDLAHQNLVRMEVYDVMGKSVYHKGERNLEEGTHEISFDLNSVKSGIYFLRLSIGNQAKSVRVVKL